MFSRDFRKAGVINLTTYLKSVKVRCSAVQWWAVWDTTDQQRGFEMELEIEIDIELEMVMALG